MAHKKKPYIKGLYKVIDKDNGKEIARNLTEESLDYLAYTYGLSPIEFEFEFEIVLQ